MEKRILIIDNDRASVEPLKAELEREGYLVSLVEEGETELSQIVKLRPDAVVYKAAPPDNTGLELLTAIRADPAIRETPILVHGIYENTDEMTTSYWEAGVDAYIPNSSAEEITVFINRIFDNASEWQIAWEAQNVQQVQNLSEGDET